MLLKMLSKRKEPIGVRKLAREIGYSVSMTQRAVSIAGPKTRMRDKRIPELGKAVRKAGRLLSRALGYEDAEGFYGNEGNEF